MNQIVQTLDQHYYLTKLLGYDCTISYKPEEFNVVADALSKREVSTSSEFLF